MLRINTITNLLFGQDDEPVTPLAFEVAVDDDSELVADGESVVFYDECRNRMLMGTLIDRYAIDGQMVGIVEYWEQTRFVNPGSWYLTIAEVRECNIRRETAWLADGGAWHHVDNWMIV